LNCSSSCRSLTKIATLRVRADLPRLVSDELDLVIYILAANKRW
jgi:hypothetical protein